MIAHVLKLLTAARLGEAAKKAVSRACIQAAVLSVAALLVLGGTIFGLIAAYLVLASIFSPAEAAGLLAAAMILAGLAVLAVRSIVMRRREVRQDQATPDAASALHSGASEIVRSMGPAQVIALSLMAGMAAGRSIRKS